MADARYHVVGIGNAIVDVLSHADDAALRDLGMTKGAMRLIEADEAEALYAKMGPAIECSGGSAANSMAGLASLGGRAAYIGKVKDDQLGAVFCHDIRAAGVFFDTPPAMDGRSTARCLIFVTPDAQRTMNTYLGASVDLSEADIDETVIEGAEITYLEGYLFDRPQAKQAFIRAAALAHRAGRKVALSLSDAFCVDRHRADFLKLVEDHIDILFANEAELLSLFQTSSFDHALSLIQGQCAITAVTRSALGSVVVGAGEVVSVPAHPVATVVDSTGAGDLYAAGFLYGLTQGHNLGQSARMGSIAAAEIIGHFGARPETSLKDFFNQVV